MIDFLDFGLNDSIPNSELAYPVYPVILSVIFYLFIEINILILQP